MAVILRITPSLPTDWMGIVETSQARPVGSVQGQGIGQTVGALRRCRDAPHDKPYPVVTRGIHNKHGTIKVQQQVE